MNTTAHHATHVWPTLRYRDADAAVRFIVDTLGFEEVALYRDEATQTIDHAQLNWPAGGGVMLGADREGRELRETMRPGAGSVYVVTDDPVPIYERVKKSGARVVREMREEDYGSKGFTVLDAEGVLWSFGTYAGEAAP